MIRNRAARDSRGAIFEDLGDIPDLAGARCRNRHELFDQAIEGSSAIFARRAARQVCASCPALEACGAWVEALPQYQRPRGIVAGRLIDVTGRFPAEVARKRRLAATRGSTVVAKCQ